MDSFGLTISSIRADEAALFYLTFDVLICLVLMPYCQYERADKPSTGEKSLSSLADLGDAAIDTVSPARVQQHGCRPAHAVLW